MAYYGSKGLREVLREEESMKQKNQHVPSEGEVISLAVAKKLNALGVQQESSYYWYVLEAAGYSSTPKLVDKQYRDAAVNGAYEWDYAFIPAYTMTELEELLLSLLDHN